jgi:hypothetical protein
MITKLRHSQLPWDSSPFSHSQIPNSVAFSPQANYTDRAHSQTLFLKILFHVNPSSSLYVGLQSSLPHEIFQTNFNYIKFFPLACYLFRLSYLFSKINNKRCRINIGKVSHFLTNKSYDYQNKIESNQE